MRPLDKYSIYFKTVLLLLLGMLLFQRHASMVLHLDELAGQVHFLVRSREEELDP